MKNLFLSLTVIALILSSCSAADVASQNLSAAADNFEVPRRIIFYNGISGEYILVIEGLCSLGNHDLRGELSVTCQISPGEYKKHYLGLSDNVTYFAEQMNTVQTNRYNYRVIFRPSVIIPSIELGK